MTFTNCETRINCTGIAIIASLILGIITAFLQITALIAIPVILLQSVILIALAFLLVVLIAVSLTHAPCRELCSILSTLSLGSLGSILFATILLIIDIVTTSVIGAILVGLLVFSFSLLLSATVCLTKCIARCND